MTCTGGRRAYLEEKTEGKARDKRLISKKAVDEDRAVGLGVVVTQAGIEGTR